MHKRMISVLIIIAFMVTGCGKQVVRVVEEKIVDSQYEEEVVLESITEFKLKTLDLHTLEPYEVIYTPYESDRYVYAGVNNIHSRIDEYYNENTNLYSYVLTIEEKELEENSEFISYKIIKIDVGTLRDEDKGIYTLSTSSPIFISSLYREDFEMDFVGQTYFLFNASERLFDEEFRVELVMVDETGHDEDEVYSKTFRLIHVSGGGVDGHTIVTD